MDRKSYNECYDCKHKRKIPGNCHIACANPDPKMTGDPHAKAKGWFFYPGCFDPIWKTRLCSNFEPVET
jgi:hypothetical protein